MSRDGSRGQPRILLLKLGAMGDVIATLPLLHRLRLGLPGAHITWAVEPRALPIVEGHPELDQVIVHRRGGPGALVAFVHALRRARFDVVLDLQRILKTGVITALSGAARRIGFDRARAKELSYLLVREHLRPRDARRLMAHQYLEFADALGVADCETRCLLPPAIAQAPAAPGDVAIGIGAGKPANRWPVERFVELVDELGRDDLHVSLIGAGRREEQAAAAIARRARTAVDVRVGRTTIAEVAGLLRGARLYLGLDSGVTHLASALGRPVLALFGPADERRTGPFDFTQDRERISGARVLRTHPPCAPCGRRHCPLGTHACMVDLSAAAVAGAVREMLRALPPPERSLAQAPTASRT